MRFSTIHPVAMKPSKMLFVRRRRYVRRHNDFYGQMRDTTIGGYHRKVKRSKKGTRNVKREQEPETERDSVNLLICVRIGQRTKHIMYPKARY